MMSLLPPIDLHAHIDPTTPEDDLRGLGAVIFAATRSLTEADRVLQRHDTQIVWGVGTHPAVTTAHKDFDTDKFRALIAQTACVSEIGLDGSCKVPIDVQMQTLRGVLKVLAETPRITSLHSVRATDQVVEMLAAQPVPGTILHWWLGSVTATAQAVQLGCYFSINAAMFRRPGALRYIPLDRLLTETDHPYGDRSGPNPRQPGNVLPVEHALAKLHGLEPGDLRRTIWRNVNRLAHEADCNHLLNRRIRSYLIMGGES